MIPHLLIVSIKHKIYVRFPTYIPNTSLFAGEGDHLNLKDVAHHEGLFTTPQTLNRKEPQQGSTAGLPESERKTGLLVKELEFV